MSAYQIFFITFIIHIFIKKRSTDTYTGRCENMWLILKRDRKCQCHIWTSCWWRFAHFWIGARLNHYQYHLIWEPGCHRASFISNSQLDFTIYHSLLSFSFQKSKEIFLKWQKVLKFLIWYFDFWKLMSDSSLLNIKILNLLFLKF